ncbi:MAG TPA: PDGLE domain-containing protein [Methanoregulaceae archaeon]|nr:PDGLE domain-containing protein [Methanoregulaceae archaeon]
MIDNKTLIACGLIIAIFIGILAVFLASGDPDGLESTALMIQGEKTLTGSTPPNAEIQENVEGKFSCIPAMPDYSLGEGWGSLGGIVAIIVGTVLAFGIALGVVYAMKVAGKPDR